MLMALPIVLGLASCSDDNPVDPNPLADKVAGMWYAQYDEQGTTPYEFLGEYTHVINSILLNEDGTGYGCTMYLNDEESSPIFMYGGYTLQGGAKFNYSTTADGRITLKFDADDPIDKEYAKMLQSWTITYADGHITCTYGSDIKQLEKASEAMEAWLQSTAEQYGGGASADTYNINDEDFTPTTWREQEAIYIYDGTGKDVTDAKGRTGYTLVNMPWYRGDVLTNLPNGFCDDITPENGWEWVLNRCGSRTIVNCNFFAVYNKYSGILRFFYYLPYGFNAGNDHVWQVSMTDHLAQQSNWKYGLPSDKTIVDKAAIGQTGSGTFMDYVTPWVDYMSPDGLITPNAGWWAFDVDLSQTRQDGIQSTDNIKLQMRSWNTSHISLASTVAANIDGSLQAQFDLTKTSVSSAKGLFESFSDIKGIGSGIFNAVKSAISGDYKDAIKTAFGVAKDGYTLYGAMTKETTTSVDTLAKGSLTGTVNLAMTGNIDTEGVIRGSVPTVGIASPTISMKDFDTKNSHLGQGVWNLKTPPVVYWTNVDAWWKEHQWISGHYSNGQAIPHFNYCQMTPYFFDPNSVEIELNPNIFPTSEIEWVEVDAICGARKGSQLRNDALRSAFGVGGSTSRNFARTAWRSADWERYYIPRQLKENDFLMDFLHDYDDKRGMSPSHVIYSMDNGDSRNPIDPNSARFSWTETVKGRGADGYAIEPQYLGGYETAYMPFLEVSVTVLVKLKGMDTPIVLSRTYLPEIKSFDATEFNNAIHKAKPYASKMNGHTELYDYQMKRIYTILNDYDVNAIFPDGFIPKLTHTSGSPGVDNRYNCDKIFDDNWSTYWYSENTVMTNGVWFVEFRSSRPFAPTKYYMVPGPFVYNLPWSESMNPYNWRLLAKAKENDQWTTIATVTNDDKLPRGMFSQQARVEYPLDVTGKTWQYFRLEILNTLSLLALPPTGAYVQLSEFDFGKNY